MDVGESLRAHVEDKIRTTVSRYFDGTTSGHVVLSKEGSWFRADCGLHLSSGVDLYAESKGQEPYATFDVAAEKIERRLRRYKRRLKDRHGAVDHHVAKGELDASPVEIV